MIPALARLIRLPNLVIVALTQYLLYYFVFYTHFHLFQIGMRLDLVHFSLLVLVTLMLTAGGYVINDVMDQEADRINKPHKQVINRYLSRRTALWFYFCLQALGFFVALYLSFHIGNLKLLSLYPAASIGLYGYSSHLKRQPFWGHLLISLYCAGVALVVWLAERPGFRILSEMDPQLVRLLRQIIISYAIFAFLTTLLRELIKVLEDEAGDRQAGYNTTAIAWGQDKVKGLCILLGIILLFLLLINSYFFSQFFSPIRVFLVAVALALPTLLIISGLSSMGLRTNFKQLSRLTKLLMLLGVLVLLTFG